MVGWIGIMVAVLAAIIAWRSLVAAHDANRLSHDSNDLATRALAMSESEHAERERERNARARLHVTVGVAGREVDDDGILRLGGSNGYLQLSIAIVNDGDRDAGRGKVVVTLPTSISDTSTYWSDPSGRQLPDHPERAARIEDEHVMSRRIDGVGRNLGETLYLRVPVVIPAQGVQDYPICVRVESEGAEREMVENYVLRIGRTPNS